MKMGMARDSFETMARAKSVRRHSHFGCKQSVELTQTAHRHRNSRSTGHCSMAGLGGIWVIRNICWMHHICVIHCESERVFTWEFRYFINAKSIRSILLGFWRLWLWAVWRECDMCALHFKSIFPLPSGANYMRGQWSWIEWTPWLVRREVNEQEERQQMKLR